MGTQTLVEIRSEVLETKLEGEQLAADSESKRCVVALLDQLRNMYASFT
jgi:hypothetical protein